MSVMIVRAQQTLFGIDLSTNHELLLLFAAILILLGLGLGFAGRRIWKHVMSFIGAVFGGILGFALGAAVGGLLIGLIVGAIGAFIGSALFVFIARVGVGVLGAILGYVVVEAITNNSTVSLVAAVIMFVVTFAFAEVAIGIVTAIVGGLLVGIGLLWLEVNMTLAVIAMLAVMVLGGAFQMIALKDEEERKHRARLIAAGATPVAARAVSAPAPPPMPGRACARCATPLRYIPEYNAYYCDRCQQYE